MKVVPKEYNSALIVDATWKPNNISKKPNLTYVIAAMPRSGSNLLTRQLCRAGVGLPAEYLQPFLMKPFTEEFQLPVQGFAEYLDLLKNIRQTPTGVFGLKAHWEQFEPVSKDIIFERLGHTRFILTRRRNIAAQAISLERAFKTGKWDPRWKPNLESRDSAADPEDLERLIRRCKLISEEEGRWIKYFSDNSIAPLEIYYEDLISDQDLVMQRIFRFLELDAKVPEVEPAPKGRTGEVGRDNEVLKALKAALKDHTIKRAQLS